MRLRFIAILFIFMHFYGFLSAQQDPRKMLEEAKKQMAADTDMDPETKKQIMDMLNSSGIEKAMSNPDVLKTQTIELRSLPAMDKKRLASIPSGIFTKDKLQSFVQNISSKITAQLGPEDRRNVQSLIKKANGSSIYLSTEAVVAWYNGSPKRALSLASHAASLPENKNALNNLSAMLNICGYEEKAVPLLLFVLQHDEKNSVALNNLGRAYLGLGDKKKAEQYYLQCVATAPTHPEANNALGCLYEEAGDPVKAKAYFEKSIEGGFNEEAVRHIEKLSPREYILPLVRKHHKAPAYFNQFKFQVPEECYTHMDYYRVKALHKSFQDGLSALSNVYYALKSEEEKKVNQQIKDHQRKITQALSTGKMPSGPFGLYPLAPLAARVLAKLPFRQAEVLRQFERNYEKDIKDLTDRKNQKAKEITASYKAQYKMVEMGECGICCANCEEVNKTMCKALEKSALDFQRAAASVHKNYVDKSRIQLTGYFDEAIYWYALLGPSQETFNVNFYNAVTGFLDAMEKLSESTPFLLGPTTCDERMAPEADAVANKYTQPDKPDCPLDITIPFIIGKLKLDCSSFSISGGEGVTGSYSKNFVTGQSTLSIGAGLTLEAGAKGVTASVGASESIYVTFDRNGNPSDAGLKFSSSAEISAGNISVGGDGGYTMGMNSGWDFTSNAPSATISL